jgi:cytochrome P450
MTQQQAPISYPFATPPTIYHPSPELAELRENRPVAQVTMADGTLAWLVTRYADVRQVLTDPRFSRAAAAGPDAPARELGALETESLIGMDPPEHTRMRRLVARAFTPRRVEQLRPWVANLVHELIDGVQARPRPVDLAAHFSTPLPVEVISELLGVPKADRHRCKAWSDTMMGDWQRDPEGTRAALDGFAGMIAAKRADPADDLITALITAWDEQDQLSEQDLVSVCVGVLIGGHETTTNQINLFLLTLLRHPEELARLRADPDAIAPAVEELTRFIQLGETGVMLPRITTEEVELSGVRIPAGMAVLPAFVAANRDPAAFADPDRLDLSRTDNPHLGFGAGVHHCLGAQLARMELQEALRGLLRRLPDLRLAIPESGLRFKQGLAVRSLDALPITW